MDMYNYYIMNYFTYKTQLIELLISSRFHPDIYQLHPVFIHQVKNICK